MVARITILSILALASAVDAAGIGGDGTGQRPADTVGGLIANLGSTHYAVREAATLGLMRLSPAHLGEVEAALAREMDPETANRLERAAVHLYMKARTPLVGDVGVLGISLELEAVQVDPKRPTVQMAVLVVKTQPGFPAAEVLEPCDRILAVNGAPFTLQTNADDFRKMVLETQPGETLMLKVLREGKLLELPVRVAGLRTDDEPLLQAIVQKREAEIAAYEVSLKKGVHAGELVIGDDAGG